VPESPTAAAVRTAGAVTGRVRVTVGARAVPPWEPWTELAGVPRLTRLVDSTAVWSGGGEGRAARAAAASLAVGDLAAALAAPVAGALVGRRRSLLPGHGVAVRFGRHGVEDVAFAAPVLGVLPGDPLAGRADVLVLPDLDAVRRTAAEAFTEAVRPVADTLCALGSRGRHGLWGEIAEALAGAVFLAVRATGRAADAPAELSRLLAVAPPELRHSPVWVDVAPGVPWKRRTVCCLAYRTPRWAEEYCATCPLVPPAETVRRLRG
jgi:hypothetical protein